MAKRMKKIPEVMDGFKRYVDALGGDNCTAWSQVAHFLKTQYNYYVDKPQSLKRVYLTLFKEQNDLQANEIALLIKTSLEYDFQPQASLYEFQKYVTVSIFQHKNYVVRYFKKALQLFINTLSKKKVHYIKQSSKLHFKSLTLMLNLYKAQDDDQLIQEIKQYSIILRKLYFELAEHIFLIGQRSDLYASLQIVCGRHSFEKVLLYLDYIHTLKMLYSHNLKDMYSHPFLCRNAAKNKTTILYKRYIEYNDYGRMFDLYNESMVDTQDVQRNFPQTDDRIFHKSVSKFQNKIKPRPRFGIAKEPLNRDPHTVIFLTDADKFEEQMPIQEVKQQNKKLNELYQEAFKFEIHQEQQI